MPADVVVQLPPQIPSPETVRECVRAAGIPDAQGVCVHCGDQLEATAATLRSCGYRIAALIASRGLIDPAQPDLYDAGYPAWCDALAAGRSHGIPLVVGPLAELPRGATARHDDVFRYSIDSLRKIRFDAERCGVRMGLRVPAELNWSTADQRELIDEANSYWVGVEFDLSAHPADSTVADLELLAHRVVAVRVGAADTAAIGKWGSVIEQLRLDAPLRVDWPGANSPRR